MPLKRNVEQDNPMMEFKCEAFAEEKLYGPLRKPGSEAPQEVRQPGGFTP